MTTAPQSAMVWSRKHPYERWIESLGVPIYKSYFVDDVRTLELGIWKERGCKAAFLQLSGQEGIAGAYVTEIQPGETLPPFKLAIDDQVYVAQGRGITAIWAGDPSTGSGQAAKRLSFEWGKRSMFLLPANTTYQLSNTSGSEPVRLLHANGLPTAMAAIADPGFYVNNPYVNLSILYGDEADFYSEAKVFERQGVVGGQRKVWTGNFFPDLLAWDKLDAYRERGAGGSVVFLVFPRSLHASHSHPSHMSVFPAGTYKKAHRHGPGVVIIIPGGEGFSFMWKEGEEKVLVPWHEGSVFVPPNRWFHQHFNVGERPARYLAIHPPTGMPVGADHFDGMVAVGEEILDPERDQIEYPKEDRVIRETFERELAKRGLKSLMPDGAYRDRNYQWETAATVY